jgi:hypothetical protein
MRNKILLVAVEVYGRENGGRRCWGGWCRVMEGIGRDKRGMVGLCISGGNWSVVVLDWDWEEEIAVIWASLLICICVDPDFAGSDVVR